MTGVFLVGFMGAGKSSVGRALSEYLSCVFEDLDERIEREQGRSVAEIFLVSGEEEFRRVERAALGRVVDELAPDCARIVGLGGGAFVFAENAKLLQTPGVLTVFLDAPAEELWRRCLTQAQEQGRERPLFQSREQFQMLFEKRRPAYLKASLRVETADREVGEIAREIAEILAGKNLKQQKKG